MPAEVTGLPLFDGIPATQPVSWNGPPVQTVHFSQSSAIRAIRLLYGDIQLDATFASGGMWKGLDKPPLRSDLKPTGNVVADFRDLPYASGSIKSMMLDPPFIHAGSGVMDKQFSSYRTQGDLAVALHGAIVEAARVLRPGGILVLKCQDIVEHDRQVWNHCSAMDMARSAGLDVLDLFVLVAAARIIGHNHGAQVHARKYHSFFWVFGKPNRRLRK